MLNHFSSNDFILPLDGGLQAKLENIYEKMEKAARRSGRKKEEIQLVAVTKDVPPEKIREAVRLGIQIIGESKVQEALDKYSALHSSFPNLSWHFIGHLQRNKVNRALEIFDTIQSVDSEKLAQIVDRRAGELHKIQEVMVEVKVSEEPTKSGLLPEELESFLEHSQSLKNVRILGMMVLAPYFEDREKTRPYFAKARDLFYRFFITHHSSLITHPVLSMGMSHDFEVAIEEGSNMIRIGTALFGERND